MPLPSSYLHKYSRLPRPFFDPKAVEAANYEMPDVQ
jgi:hypothetical protein